MELETVYAKPRESFGHPVFFEDVPATLVAAVEHSDETAEQFTTRAEQVTELDCSPMMSETAVNTERRVTLSTGVHHAEGGWPRDVEWNDQEQTSRYRKRVMKSGEYRHAVAEAARVVDYALNSNNAVDIYEDFFASQSSSHFSEPPTAHSVAVIRDPSDTARGVAAVSWHAEDAMRLAAAYCDPLLRRTAGDADCQSYVWNVNQPGVPELDLLPKSPLSCLAFNPKDTYYVAGGSVNGLLSLFDIRAGSQPQQTSSIEHSHRDVVRDFKWVVSKAVTGMDCVSVGADGQVLWWDARRLSEPSEQLDLVAPAPRSQVLGGLGSAAATGTPPGSPRSLRRQGTASGAEEGGNLALCGTRVEFRAQAGANKFLVGTEQGLVFNCNRKAKTPAARLGHSLSAHACPVYGLQRSPFNVRYFLSCGGWSARLWSDELTTPVLSTQPLQEMISAGCWSPTRPGVYFTSTFEGSVDVWDMLCDIHGSTLRYKVGSAPIQSLAPQPVGGGFLAAGDQQGSVTVLQLSQNLARPQANERAVVAQMLDRFKSIVSGLETARQDSLEDPDDDDVEPLMPRLRDGADVEREADEMFFKHISDAAKSPQRPRGTPGRRTRRA